MEALSRCMCIRVLQRTARKVRLRRSEGRRSTDRRNVQPSATHFQALPSENASAAEARHTPKRYRLTVLRARSPLGAPLRYLPRKSMPRLGPGRASCEREGTGVTRTTERSYSDAPRAPVIVPAGPMPRPPGSEITSPARRNRTRPVSRPSPVTSLHGRDCCLYLTL
jgi:hypothetical protein